MAQRMEKYEEVCWKTLDYAKAKGLLQGFKQGLQETLAKRVEEGLDPLSAKLIEFEAFSKFIKKITHEHHLAAWEMADILDMPDSVIKAMLLYGTVE